MRHLTLIFALAFSPLLLAAPKTTVHGVLKGFDNDTVRIQTGASKVIKVPRQSIKTSLKGLTVGVSEVQAQLSLDDLVRLNDSKSWAKGPQPKKNKK